MIERKPMLVFDVESVGLFGDPFAVGSVLIGPDGSTLSKASNKIPLANARGTDEDRAWVRENVPAEWLLDAPDWSTPADLCRGVVGSWVEMTASNGFRVADVLLFADVGWPVEHRFLELCVKSVPGYVGPYPLLDVGSVIFAAGYDPTATYRRHREHYPTHDPLKDAAHSARLLVSVLEEVDAALKVRNSIAKAVTSGAGLVLDWKDGSP